MVAKDGWWAWEDPWGWALADFRALEVFRLSGGDLILLFPSTTSVQRGDTKMNRGLGSRSFFGQGEGATRALEMRVLFLI